MARLNRTVWVEQDPGFQKGTDWPKDAAPYRVSKVKNTTDTRVNQRLTESAVQNLIAGGADVIISATS